MIQLDKVKAERFAIWFHKAYENCVQELLVKEAYRRACTNQTLGAFFRNFGMTFLDNTFERLANTSEKEILKAGCPLNFAERDVIAADLYRHLGECLHCREINSIRVRLELERETKA